MASSQQPAIDRRLSVHSSSEVDSDIPPRNVIFAADVVRKLSAFEGCSFYGIGRI